MLKLLSKLIALVRYIILNNLSMSQSKSTIILIYISRAAIKFDDAMVVEIAAKAAEKNKTLDITGLLLRAGNHFLQIIEGPDDNVQKLFAKIKQDSRHTNLRTIYREPEDNRYFGQWSMNYLPLEGTFNLGPTEISDLKNLLENYMDGSHDLSQVIKFIKFLPDFFAKHKVDGRQ